MKTPPQGSSESPSQDAHSVRNRVVLAGILTLGVAAFLAYQKAGNSIQSSDGKGIVSESSGDPDRTSPLAGESSHESSGTQDRGGSQGGKSPAAATRGGPRGVVQDGRKTVVDPMASWSEVPAWPEGPRLFAEVETSSKRYVNLRPNDLGLMPRLNLEANESIKISITLPEGGAGDTIYVEIPNGGRFPDVDLMGQSLAVDGKGRVAFDFIADESRGHCTVHIRQNGHTRTLPLWVGQPETFVREDPASPNEPTP